MSQNALSVYSQYCTGIRVGANDNYTCYCPIHGEQAGVSKSRSLSFHASTGAWVCYSGCGGGYLPQFLKLVGLNREKISQKMSRITLEKAKEKVNRFQKPKNVLPEKILGLWDRTPKTMLKLGFTQEILDEHDIGYDSKRRRITFPIRDIRGRLRGVSGRATSDQNPVRYKVYEEEIAKLLKIKDYRFQKSEHLWRAHLVWPQLEMNDDPVLLCEGFKVAMWLRQAGANNVVAMMTAYLSRRQRAIIELFDRPVIFCQDNDRAGIENTVKNSNKVNTLKCLALEYPEGVKQLDELSLESALELVRNPITMKQFRKRNKGKSQ